jgi:uncharacterized sporulation protein YeaH/YhbH (DUF444 family)
MKDLPRHMKKINRQVIRSAARENEIEEAALPPFHDSSRETRKKIKRKMRSEALNRTPIHDSPEERNQKMKHRVPIFDRNNAEPKRTRATKKKTPRI